MNFFFQKKLKIIQGLTNPQVDDVGCELENFFDKNISESLEITDIKKYSFSVKGYVSYDYLYLKNETNKINKERLKFILYESTIGNRPAVIGLEYPRITEVYNIFTILKEMDIITSYNWMVNYTSSDEGNFIVGELLHNIDKQNYKEEDLLVGHPFTYSAMQLKWGLRMDDILFNGENFRPNHECYFYYEYNYIEGIDYLERELDKFFNDSFNNHTCAKVNIKYPYGPNKFYYCNKTDYKNNMKYFPPLQFLHKEMNYTFELTYEDLFIEKNDKLILLIFFQDRGITWKLGKPFLKKYGFIMNQDDKVVRFYEKYGYQKNDDDNQKMVIMITMIGVGVIILVVLGIFIGKYLFKKKRRLNTIDDEYEYNEANKEELIN